MYHPHFLYLQPWRKEKFIFEYWVSFTFLSPCLHGQAVKQITKFHLLRLDPIGSRRRRWNLVICFTAWPCRQGDRKVNDTQYSKINFSLRHGWRYKKCGWYTSFKLRPPNSLEFLIQIKVRKQVWHSRLYCHLAN